MLKRKFYNTLVEWKSHHRKEGLLVKGARQVGKTFIIDCFGREQYQNYFYFNFITNPEHREIFEGSLEAEDIFKKISSMTPEFSAEKRDTLFFFDEIQNCPKARTAIKPLAIDGRVDVIASGSLLGLTYLNDDQKLAKERQESSIPVGYERQLTMYPLDFEEYMWALGYRRDVVDDLRESFASTTPLPTSTNARMHSLFREFIVNGGMPDVVNTFVETHNFGQVFETQTKILNANLDDISRYAPNIEKPKIRNCYLSMPHQLARENKKFKFSEVAKSGRSRMFESSIDWLQNSALAIKCHNVETPTLPLRAYQKEDCFKLYASDVGILVAMLGFSAKKPILDDSIKDFAKGGIYGNVVVQHLVANGHNPSYFRPKSNQAEIDFLIETGDGIVPIEVKATNSASKSFDDMLLHKDIRHGYKFTSENLGRVGKKITLPHYMSMFI